MTYFVISDLHLSFYQNETLKYNKLVKFFDFIRYKGNLILLGDIFDFWFEYPFVIPSNYFRFLDLLYNFPAEIYFVAGNHDLWVGDFFQRIGIKTFLNYLSLEIGDKKWFFTHGDMDKLLRKFLLFSLNVKLFKALPTFVGFNIAKFFSKLSRKRSERKLKIKLHPDFFKYKDLYDGLCFAHLHYPDLRKIKGKVYLNTGDWVKNFTFASINERKVILYKFCCEKFEIVKSLEY